MDEPSPLRRELDIPDEAVVTLYSGSMGAKQGIEQLIEAARLLAGRRAIRIGSNPSTRNVLESVFVQPSRRWKGLPSHHAARSASAAAAALSAASCL